MESEAFIFDLNGTMINDMDYHIIAWYKIVNSLGAVISMQNMKEECYGKNEEVLERIFPGRFSKIEKGRMSLEKEQQYQQVYKPNLRLIQGLEKFLFKVQTAGVKMAIGSAAIRYNIDFVLDGLNIRHYFDAIVGAEDVLQSKLIHPLFYRQQMPFRLIPGLVLFLKTTLKVLKLH